MAIVTDAQCTIEGCDRIVQAKWTGLCRNHHRDYLANLSRDGLKACTSCNAVKPLAEFSPRRTRTAQTGTAQFKPRCKICNAAATREWSERNPDYRKRWNEANRERRAGYARYQKYGILPETLDRMIAEQNGKCAICAGSLERPQVDHDHATGKVREILCPNCNMALGLFQDSAPVLRSAALYLERHKN